MYRRLWDHVIGEVVMQWGSFWMDPRGSHSSLLLCNALQVNCRKTWGHEMLESYSALNFKITFWNLLGDFVFKTKDKRGNGAVALISRSSSRKPTHGGMMVISQFSINADHRAYVLVVEFQMDVETNPVRDISSHPVGAIPGIPASSPFWFARTIL